MRRPRFKSHFVVRILEPDLLFLLYETGYLTLEGRLWALLAPLLDGRNTIEEIAELLRDRLTIVDIRYGLAQLEQEGYIVDAGADEPPGVEAFREILGVGREEYRERLARVTVAVRAFGAVPAEAFEAALRSVDVCVAGDGDFTAVLVDDYLRDELDAFNRAALDQRRTWMLIKPVGAVLWLGPVFRPFTTGCWACLSHRLRESRQRQVQFGAQAGPHSGATLSAARLPATLASTMNLAALEILKWIVRPGKENLDGRLLTLDTVSATLDTHVLLRRDGCPACGQANDQSSTRVPAPLTLQSRRKVFVSDGGHRAVPPELTYDRLKHHVSSILGVVESLEQHDQDPSGLIHVWLAGHNFPLKYQRSLLAQWTTGRKSAGKGMTRAQAVTGALCEALERYSGIFRGNEARIAASYQDLGGKAIHPSACMNFSDAQYRDRAVWNERESELNWVPEPFDEARPVEWAPAWSLTSGEYKYLPAAWCYYNYPAEPGHDFCRADSNGNAAGTNLEEAILQGFMEVVERDAVALWWYNRLRRPAVDLSGFGQTYFPALARYYQNIGRELWVLDITSDFGIPCFAAVSRGSDTAEPRLTLGFGAHLDPAIAAARALTEMNQFLPAVLQGRSIRLFTGDLPDAAFLEADPLAAPKRPGDYESFATADLREDVLRCVALARNLGVETLVLDQTRPDVGLHVVKVVLPGARPFWARFAPGRLYTVPVKMDWRTRPCREEDLNPAHLAM